MQQKGLNILMVMAPDVLDDDYVVAPLPKDYWN
jgi:hypothetical protein